LDDLATIESSGLVGSESNAVFNFSAPEPLVGKEDSAPENNENQDLQTDQDPQGPTDENLQGENTEEENIAGQNPEVTKTEDRNPGAKNDKQGAPGMIHHQSENSLAYKGETSMVNSSILNTSQIQREFGDKLYKNQSASTLTHSITSYTVPKRERFDKLTSLMSQGSMYNLQSTLTKRGTTLGYGNRSQLSSKQIGEKSAQPGPNHYIVNGQIDKGVADGRGKSFGLGYAYYQKACPAGIKTFKTETESRGIPGPGTYRTEQEFALGKPKYTVNKRGKMFNERIKTISPGAIYEMNYDLVERRRYGNGVGFGLGGRSDFARLGPNSNPGPGNYKLPSIFDKFYSK